MVLVSPVTNKHPENQTVFSSPAIVPGTKSFSQAIRSQKRKNNLFVADSIPKGIRFKNSIAQKYKNVDIKNALIS